MDSDMRERVALVDELAAALQRVGTGTARVEETLRAVSEALGVPGRFHALPTAVFGTLRVGDDDVTHLVPAPTGEQDLAQLEAVREVARGLLLRTLSVPAARARLAELAAAPRRYGLLAWLGAHALVSALAALLFGGRWLEMATAATAGLLAGALVRGAARWGIAPLVTALGGILAGGLAALVAARTPLAVEPAVLGALIALVPGFTIHRALLDLASGHLLSGAARLAQALVTLLLLGFGVALGARLGGLAGAPLPAAIEAAPAWLRSAAILAMTPGLLVFFEAPARSTLWNAGAVAVAWAGAALGGSWLGPELGPALGALALGLYANAWERATGRPAALPLAPGLLVLVPGAMGLRGVAALQGGEALAAVEAGFATLMVATSLAAGLLAAHALVRVPLPGARLDGVARGPDAGGRADDAPGRALSGGGAPPAPRGA